MSTNNLLNFKQNGNGIYVLDDSHLAERESGILVPKDLVESKSGFLSSLRNKYLTTAAAISFLFSPLSVISNNNESLDNLVQDNQSNQEYVSCNCIGVSNLHAKEGFKSIGGFYFIERTDGSKIGIPLGEESIALEDLIDIKESNIFLPVEMKAMTNNGYIIDKYTNIITGTKDAQFLDLYVYAIDKKTGCKEGIRIFFSPYTNLFLEDLNNGQIRIDPKNGLVITDPNDEVYVQGNGDCIIDQISDKAYLLSTILKEKEEILKRQEEVKDALREDRTSLNDLIAQIDSLLNGNNALQREINGDKINGDEEEESKSDKRLQFSLGSNIDYFNKNKLVLGMNFPLLGKNDGTQLNFGLYGVLPSTSETTAKVFQASEGPIICYTLVDGQLTSSKLRAESEINFAIGNNNLLRVGLGGFANLSLTNHDLSYFYPGAQITSPHLTEPNINYGDIQKFRDLHFSYGPKVSLILSPFPERSWGKISFLGTIGYNLKDELSIQPFFPNKENLESTILNNINIGKVDQYRPYFTDFRIIYTLPGGSK